MFDNPFNHTTYIDYDKVEQHKKHLRSCQKAKASRKKKKRSKNGQ